MIWSVVIPIVVGAAVVGAVSLVYHVIHKRYAAFSWENILGTLFFIVLGGLVFWIVGFIIVKGTEMLFS